MSMRALSLLATISAPGLAASLLAMGTPALEAALDREPVAIASPRPLPPRAAIAREPRLELHAPAEPARGLVGVFVAQEAADVGPTSAGRLAQVRVRIGDRVRAGDVIASLEAQAQELDLVVARAQTRELQAELAVTQLRAEVAAEQDQRVVRLSDTGLASGSELAAATGDRREAALRALFARAGVARQRAVVERLERAREEAQVLAPFDGLVVARYADRGSNVAPGQPIVRIVRDGPLIVRFAVPEERTRSVRLGSEIVARAIAFGSELRAVVRRVSPEVDSAGLWSVVEAETESSSEQTLSGAAAEVFVREPAEHTEPATRSPNAPQP